MPSQKFAYDDLLIRDCRLLKNTAALPTKPKHQGTRRQNRMCLPDLCCGRFRSGLKTRRIASMSGTYWSIFGRLFAIHFWQVPIYSLMNFSFITRKRLLRAANKPFL
ncbi:hypothetical protein AVEN_143730-1 [Araneus ventricosus]|uniref:Uncharacterized protein n=1 Tax=Araneus ventricosus TaxID=182803 RepID=A0A4Y2APM1_ARAVE|nr:hypothetical protein AVEN_143730-1 [Araneus ventricosus]